MNLYDTDSDTSDSSTNNDILESVDGDINSGIYNDPPC